MYQKSTAATINYGKAANRSLQRYTKSTKTLSPSVHRHFQVPTTLPSNSFFAIHSTLLLLLRYQVNLKSIITVCLFFHKTSPPVDSGYAMLVATT